MTAVDSGVSAVDKFVTVSATAVNGHGIMQPADVTLTIRDSPIVRLLLTRPALVRAAAAISARSLPA